MQAIVETEDWDRLAFQTCVVAGMTATAFEALRRRSVLTYTHHVEVMGLPVDWQDTLLDEAGGFRAGERGRWFGIRLQLLYPLRNALAPVATRPRA